MSSLEVRYRKAGSDNTAHKYNGFFCSVALYTASSSELKGRKSGSSFHVATI